MKRTEEKQALIEALKYGFTQTEEKEKIIKAILDNPLIKQKFPDLTEEDFKEKVEIKDVIPESLEELVKILAKGSNDKEIEESLLVLSRLIASEDEVIAIYGLKTAFELIPSKSIREIILKQLEATLDVETTCREGAEALAKIYAQLIRTGNVKYLASLERLFQRENSRIQSAVVPIISSLYADFVIEGKKQFLSCLEELAYSKNQDIAQSACESLKKIYLEDIKQGRDPDLTFLEHLFEKGDLSKRIMVINILGSIYARLIKKGKSVDFQKLEDSLQSRYGGLKDAAVRALGKVYFSLIQKGEKPLLSSLERMLFADDWRIRVTTLNVFGQLYGKMVEMGEKPCVQKIETLFKDRHGSVRKAAAEALGNIYLKLIDKGDRSGLKKLEEMQHSQNWLFARVVSISLAHIYSALIQKGEMQYLPKLEIMLKENDFYVNIVTISTLATVYEKLIEEGKYFKLESLENMLHHEDIYIRIAAVSALTTIYSSLVLKGHKEYLETLEEMFSEGEWYVKKATTSALANIYARLVLSGEKKYLRNLENLLSIEDKDISQTVARLLCEVINAIIQSKKEMLNNTVLKIEWLLHKKLSSPLKGSLASRIEIDNKKIKIAYLELKRKNHILPSGCVFTQSTFSMLKTIALSYFLNHPILLLGPTSTGKSFLIKWLAGVLGYEHISYTINPYSSKFELIGGIKPDKEGKFVWQDGIILKAAKEGKWLVLEEINLASSEVIEILNDYLTTGRFFYSEDGEQRKFIPHPDFRLFATANPESYSQRQRLSEVFLSRWKIYYQEELSETEIAEILSNLFQIPASLAFMIAKFHKIMEKQSIARLIGREERDRYIYSLRDILRLGERLKNKDINDPQLLFWELYTVYLARIRDVKERKALLASLDTHFGFRIRGLNLEKTIENQDPNIDAIQVTPGEGFIPGKEGEITPTKSQNVLLSQITSAIIQSEPVLLVGMPAAGKTTLIRYLAKRKGTDLYYVNLSSDSGLEELLGGYIQDKGGRWYYRKGLLFKAIERGSWLLIDEANLNPLSEYLNTLIDFGYIIDEEGKMYKVHPNFRLFLVMNPPRIHISRNLLSPSLRSRFLEIWVEEVLKEKELKKLVDLWMQDGAKFSGLDYTEGIDIKKKRF
ncbi:MAG TPA: hypothetical protein ENF67_00715 [Candidatus Pacearchaeota archaeon]|nr:hypothetical protein [Candidatus Pacearchaeota archaeon]